MFLPLYDKNKIEHIEFPYVNYGLIGVTVLVFLFQLAQGDAGVGRIYIEYGMIPVVVRDVVESPSAWLPGQVTLLTHAFLHADWMHLLTNMLFLWVFGDNIEDALGHLRYLLFYIACAILAGLMHLAFNLDSHGPLIGASGAVAGVIGAYIVLFPHVRVFVLAKVAFFLPLSLPAWAVLGLWIGSQFVYLAIAADDGIAWWAHIGGVIAGAVLIVVFRRPKVALFGGR